MTLSFSCNVSFSRPQLIIWKLLKSRERLNEKYIFISLMRHCRQIVYHLSHHGGPPIILELPITHSYASDAGRDRGQEEKGTTENEMAGWHHWLDGRESEWTPGVGDGQGGRAYCDSWGRKESDTTERLNWIELMPVYVFLFFFFNCLKVTDKLHIFSKNKTILQNNLLL